MQQPPLPPISHTINIKNIVDFFITNIVVNVIIIA